MKSWERMAAEAGSGLVFPLVPVLTADAHDANQVLGGKMHLQGIFPDAGGSRFLNFITFGSKVDIPSGVSIDVGIFNADPAASTITDSANLSIDAADIGKLICSASLSRRVDWGTPASLEADLAGKPVWSSGPDLWAVAVIRAVAYTPTGVADGTFHFGFA